MDVKELDLSIDENNLVEEWKAQPSMMLEYGILLADAEQEVDETKAKLAVVCAELDTDIRNNPEDYGISKITESAVYNAIPQQPQHKMATKKHDEAKHNAKLIRAAVDALGHRKAALQGMTDLFMRQWYSEPQETQSEAPMKSIMKRRRRIASKE